MAINSPLPTVTDYHKTLPIIELYPCLQGEGQRRGHPALLFAQLDAHIVVILVKMAAGVILGIPVFTLKRGNSVFKILLICAKNIPTSEKL